MRIQIVEYKDGTEGVYIQGNAMESPPPTAEYRSADGKTTYVRIQAFKVEVTIEDKVKESTHEQPGS